MTTRGYAAPEPTWQASRRSSTDHARAARAFAILLCMNVDLADTFGDNPLRAGVVTKHPASLPSGPWRLALRQYYYREHATVWTSAASRPSASWKSRPRRSKTACGTRRLR